MDWLIPDIIYCIGIPVLSFYFFFRFCNMRFRWYWCTAYMVSALFLIKLEVKAGIPGIAGLFLEVLLFVGFGSLALRGKYAKALTIAALIMSVGNTCNGVLQCAEFWMISSISESYGMILKYADMAKALVYIILTGVLLAFIEKFFYETKEEANSLTLFSLLIPAVFISVVEKTVSTSIYGNTVVWDSDLGIVFPKVNSVEMFLLQAFACVCLYTALAAYQRLVRAIRSEQAVQLLEQQTRCQEIYVQEAQARYEQTRSFRHDIRNHLTVLGELLKTEQPGKAYGYLAHMEQASLALSFPIHTGNSAVDALMGSKLSVAKQRKIDVTCDIKIPDSGIVRDMDWCIVLSNAVDNAIKASALVKEGERYLGITGKGKGNFYWLHIENRCSQELKKIPEDGIGLKNIKAVAKKYGGTTKLKVAQNVFSLDILFVISQL